MLVIDVEDNPSDEIPLDFGLLSEVLCQDHNFRYPRRLLAEASFPKVNATLTSYTVGSSGSAMMDPITVKELPPQSVLNNIKKEFATSQNVASQLVVKINFVWGKIPIRRNFEFLRTNSAKGQTMNSKPV